MAKISEKREIITCPKCNGEGEITDDESRGPITICKVLKCQKCNGSGAMWQTTTISHEPYIPNEKHYKTINH